MSVSEPEFWNSRYAQGQMGWDLGQPAPPLARWLRQSSLPVPQRVAVVGCGAGHEALLFARAGHEVTGFDFAPRAVARAQQLAAEARVAATFLEGDLFTLPARYPAAFDLVVEHTCFCAIDPARREAYVQAVEALLAPGGRLVGLFFTHGRPGGPPFGSSRTEVEQLFGDHFVLDASEVPADSVPSRAGQELLALFRKPADRKERGQPSPSTC